MPRELDLYFNKLNEDQRIQVERSVEHFNSAQGLLRLVSRGEQELATWGERVDVSMFFSSSTPRGVHVTGRGLSDNWFTHAAGEHALITVDDWQIAFLGDVTGFPAEGPDTNLLVSFALTVTVVLAGCREVDIVHERTVGCLFDFCINKPERALKARAAYVCKECAATIASYGVSSVDLDAISAVLERARSLVLGKPPQSQSPATSESLDRGAIGALAESNSIDVPPRLATACRDGALSVLVGSGLSQQPDVAVDYGNECSWQRLPTWDEIPQRLAECVAEFRGREEAPRRPDSLDEMLADLDFFRKALGEGVYYPRSIMKVFYPRVVDAGIANRLLFHLPLQCVLTTSYDPLLQYAAPRGTPVFTWQESRQAREYLTANRQLTPILKLHGCAARPDTVVLSALEYERVRQNETYLSLLRQVFENHPVLFLGFGLSDPFDLDLALRQASLAGAAEGEKFAMVPAVRREEAQRRFPQIQFLPYENHDSIPPLLAKLACGT